MTLAKANLTTSTYRLYGKDIKIHAITTGLISLKSKFLAKEGKGIFSKVNIMLGQQHAGFMPIW
jgi:hypothetical protein